MTTTLTPAKSFLLLTVFLLSISIGSLLGQDVRVIDSLDNLIKEKADSDRIPLMLQLAFEYINKDNMAALTVLEDLDQVAAQSGDSSWMVKIKRVKGRVLFLLERNLESEEILINALKVAVRHKLSTERLYIEHTLGKIKLFNGEYDDALIFYFNALELAKVIGVRTTGPSRLIA